ncbi:unnamed protein product [Effrenium voratum]|nr:unnamed protein product [Effrenium voratum]
MPREQHAPGAQSLVVAHCRLTDDRNCQRLVGVPMLFCIETCTSAGRLRDAIRTQLRWVYGDAALDGWELFQTSGRWDACRANEVFCREEDAEELILRDSEHLVVHWDWELELNSSLLSPPPEETCDLEACFEWLTATEQLSLDNALLCACQRKVQAFSRVRLAELPPVLMLQLNRFEYKYGQRNRLQVPISFPLAMDLSRFRTEASRPSESAESNAEYQLMATITHSGTACRGHYMARVRSCQDGRWYLYNDDVVSEISAEEVQEDVRGTYVLFYLHRRWRPSSWDAEGQSEKWSP